MVSSLSSRLLAGRGDCGSLGSNGSRQNKRTATGSMKTKRMIINEKNENSVSGYSADREGSSTYSPVDSVNLHSNSSSSTRVDALKCPKRRKKNETQFAATTVKTDLARAGKGFRAFNKDLESSTILGDMEIQLKNRVKLVYSTDVSESPDLTSNLGKQTTITNYAALISAVSTFYARKPTQISDIKSFERTLPVVQNAWFEPSTPSVSDTLSDSGSDNANSQTSALSPLLEDSLDPCTKHCKTKQQKAKTAAKPSNDISSVSNAITMTKILQLSKTARVVMNSFAPHSIVHANAAFHRLVGQKANDTVIGKSFFSLLDPEVDISNERMTLSSLMISSSRGNDPKLYLLPKTSDGSLSGEKIEPLKCTVRVSPVLDQKMELQERAEVGYFVIELVPDGKEFDETSLTNKRNSSFSNGNTPMGVVA